MRKKKNQNRYFIGFIAVFLSVCLFFPGRETAFALSIQDEETMGREFLASIKKYYEVVDESFANELINDLGSYLIRSLETRPFKFRFYIIKSSDLNAFAGPGGHIFVFTGLIEAMEGVDELASVMCHEIGHVTSRHISDRLSQSKKIGLATLAGILAGSLLGGEAGGAIMTGSMAAGIQKQLSYSRDDERQADQLSYKYMAEAGFDSAGMVKALSRFQQGRWSSTDKIPAYLLTHPGGSERMSNIESMLASNPTAPLKKETDSFRNRYPVLRTILRANYMEPDDAERLFNLDLQKNPDSPLTRLGLGIVWKNRSDYTKAIEYFQKALEGLPDPSPALRYIGETYQLKGQDREAIRMFEKALKINERDSTLSFLLALSYQNLEDYSRAIDIYKRLVQIDPVRDEIFYNLGVCYGRQNKLGQAHYNFGIYFKRQKEIPKSKFHFRKAEELSGNDPVLLDRIKKEKEDSPERNR